jgi:hypothetical protein
MFVISKKSVIKKQEKSDLIEAGTTSKICNKHSNPTTYPSEYDKCPACAKEKLTRLILNFNG